MLMKIIKIEKNTFRKSLASCYLPKILLTYSSKRTIFTVAATVRTSTLLGL